MKTCKYCQSEIDKKAKICPTCKKKQSHIGRWIGIVAFILIIVLLFQSCAKTVDEIDKGLNDITDTSKLSIVQGTEKGYADEMNMFYYIEGTVKNDSDKKYSYVQVTYNVYDTNGNNLGSCLANNSNLEANETWKFKAVCSGNASDIASYKLAEITGTKSN